MGTERQARLDDKGLLPVHIGSGAQLLEKGNKDTVLLLA